MPSILCIHHRSSADPRLALASLMALRKPLPVRGTGPLNRFVALPFRGILSSADLSQFRHVACQSVFTPPAPAFAAQKSLNFAVSRSSVPGGQALVRSAVALSSGLGCQSLGKRVPLRVRGVFPGVGVGLLGGSGGKEGEGAGVLSAMSAESGGHPSDTVDITAFAAARSLRRRSRSHSRRRSAAASRAGSTAVSVLLSISAIAATSASPVIPAASRCFTAVEITPTLEGDLFVE